MAPVPATACRAAGGKPGATIQAMTFARFYSSRIANFFTGNWSYSQSEEDLIKLEKKCRELLDGIREYLDNSLKPSPENTQELAHLDSRLRIIEQGKHHNDDYGAVKNELTIIFNKADRLSARIAAIDIPLENGYDLAQKEALPSDSFPITKTTSLEELIGVAQTIAKKQNLADAAVLREVLDVLVQAVSDALMKFDSLLVANAIAVKHKVIQIALDLHTAYLLATVNKDKKNAQTLYIKATAGIADHMFASGLFALFSERTRGKAYPKYREALEKPYDTGAILLAEAFKADNFVPDILVGLPTGGVHAANRVAAALLITTGKRPIIWTTRPQGVKQESKAFMEGTSEFDILSFDEKSFLVKTLIFTGPRRSTLKIAIVDDGFVSGTTMVLCKELYRKEFASYATVDVRTGVIEAGWNQAGRTFNGKPNPADYVVVPSLNASGRTGPLEDELNARDSRIPNGSIRRDLNQKLGVVTSDRSVTIRTPSEMLAQRHE